MLLGRTIVCHQVIMLETTSDNGRGENITQSREEHRESLYDPERQKCVDWKNIITNELFASIH